RPPAHARRYRRDHRFGLSGGRGRGERSSVGQQHHVQRGDGGRAEDEVGGDPEAAALDRGPAPLQPVRPGHRAPSLGLRRDVSGRAQRGAGREPALRLALPFLQTAADYWSAGAGLELLPKGAPYRLSARGEYKDGALQSTRLATVAGDVAFDASLALLTRQEFSQNARSGAPLSRRLSSLWGLAFRPAHTDRLNMLAKFQWTDDRNPR